MSDPTDKHPVGGVDYPGTLQEFDKWFPERRIMRNLFDEPAMAQRLYLSDLRRHQGLDDSSEANALRWLSTPDICNRRYDF